MSHINHSVSISSSLSPSLSSPGRLSVFLVDPGFRSSILVVMSSPLGIYTCCCPHSFCTHWVQPSQGVSDTIHIDQLTVEGIINKFTWYC